MSCTIPWVPMGERGAWVPCGLHGFHAGCMGCVWGPRDGKGCAAILILTFRLGHHVGRG